MFQPDLLKGKRILVTGGGTGLGRSMAQRYLELGANVVICGRREDVLKQTAEELAKATGKAPRWNFHKYLIDRGGRQVLSFETQVEPTDLRLVSSIEKFLAGR